MSDRIPPAHGALREALELSGEILRNLELSDIPLGSVALKASRLARLLNDSEMQIVFEHESSGYPTTPDGVPPDTYKLAAFAGREFQHRDANKDSKKYVYLESIQDLERQISTAHTRLEAARDPNVSVASANPSQFVWAPPGNAKEREALENRIRTLSTRLSSRRALLHRYIAARHYELKFSSISDDIFSRIRERVDGSIGRFVPEAVKKLSAVYENLTSENPEDWSNAVHSCRRVLQDLADSVFPPQAQDRAITVAGKQRTVKLGKDNYINRLLAFVGDQSDSERFDAIVGSQISYLADRLEAAFRAAQKGSHDTIVSRQEADRYVVYTYLVVGDILTLTSVANTGVGAKEVVAS
jgi:hypothetical protein